jgi:putative copper export protein
MVVCLVLLALPLITSSHLTSRVWVVDVDNRQVDSQDSHVRGSALREMDLLLSLLPAGTYVVWRTLSPQDGHVVAGSDASGIVRPRGPVSLVPALPPAGHIRGTRRAVVGGASGLDGPTVLQVLATWLALTFMGFWVGGVIWETWILSPTGTSDPDLTVAACAARQRFRRLAPWALGGLLVANVAIVLVSSVELAGGWARLSSLPLLRAILAIGSGSQYGAFWIQLEGVTGIALVMALLEARGLPFAVSWRSDSPPEPEPAAEPARLVDWPRWLLRSLGCTPGALARGWRRRTLWGRATLALAAALPIAFAFSGHAAAAPRNELAYALSVDLLHLLGNAAWLGGLFYIAVVLIPALRALNARGRARVLALGLPAFSALALVSVTVLAATGGLNATIRLTSISQVLTTAYGRTLAVKIELFLLMVGISAYHAFFLRPRLAQSLTQAASPASPPTEAVDAPSRAMAGAITWSGAGGARAGSSTAMPVERGDKARLGRGEDLTRAPAGHEAPRDPERDDGATPGSPERPISVQAQRLIERLEDWLQREAVVGVGILLCVALLGAFAGSLTPATATATGSGPGTGAFVQTEQAGGYAVTLKVTPDAFGTNTFTVTLHDAQQRPVDGASVLIATEMLDMDMGVQTAQLQPIGISAPGSYSGQSDLTMAGHWRVTVKVLPPNSSQFSLAVFTFSATY